MQSHVLSTHVEGLVLDSKAFDNAPIDIRGPHAWRSVVGLLDSRPDIVAINAAIEQKALAEG